MPTKVTLYPIYNLADAIDGQPFDHSVLPAQILDAVTIECVSPMFNEQTFLGVKDRLGSRTLKTLQSVQYAIVHRYETDESGAIRSEPDKKSEWLVRNASVCLRLVRPMRQRALLMHGVLREDGTIHVQHFEHPIEHEVPEVQKHFRLRNCDVELLKAVIGQFLRAMEDDFWKFRMAVEFYQAGHFQSLYWKARYILWCSAMEAIFTSNSHEHRGSVVAKERIKWFLGPDTPIYEPGDIPNFAPQSPITIAQVLDDMYDVRNYIAHGDRIPEEYFQRVMREGLNRRQLNVLEVLQEAVSFIDRKSLLRILQDDLLDHFRTAETAIDYFAAAGFTLTEIRKSTKRAQR